MKQALAMVLAGGRGKRMDIFCDQRPKPVLPFAGKYRVIDITLSNCVHSQIEDIAVLVDYQKSAIIDYINRWNLANQQNREISLLQPKSGSYTGTANAVYQNLAYLATKGVDTVLILAGDHIYNMDYRDMLAFHYEMQADVTVGITHVPLHETSRFGTLATDFDGRIKEFVEKSSTPVSNLASMGIYVFNRKFLMNQLINDAQNANSPHDFGYAILPNIVKQNRVFGYVFNGYWQDIGTVESYYQTNMQLLGGENSFDLSNKMRPMLTVNGSACLDIVNVPGSIVNSLISPGCFVEGYVENSILSPGVRVEEKAEVVNSIVMDNTLIKYHSIVDRCILDEGVSIDKFCYLGFGKASVYRVNDITLVGKDVHLGPETAIGRKSKILPGSRLYNISNRVVASESVVSVTL
jgi:glucose-1-phosphate adenylyltransferase